MSQRYPWYDSSWLTRYARAKELIQAHRPERLPEFIRSFDPLRTRSDFQVLRLPRVFDDPVMEGVRETLRKLKAAQLELHEIPTFGRFVVHNHPTFTELQQSTVDLVVEAVGEPVEPSYNFMSMYTKLGRCPVHMDAPSAKWTLDVCINQSEPWPIHLSQVLPWPENFSSPGNEWQTSILRAKEHRFTAYHLDPGNALIFSGSSQWHHREALPGIEKERPCDLLFFHFIPKGMGELVDPKSWPRVFGIPELAAVASVSGDALAEG